MDSERHRRIVELFRVAADLPDHAREDLVADLCGSDRELKRAVECLLRNDREDSFLESPLTPRGSLAEIANRLHPKGNRSC
jgi:hypothetical protein